MRTVNEGSWLTALAISVVELFRIFDQLIDADEHIRQRDQPAHPLHQLDDFGFHNAANLRMVHLVSQAIVIAKFTRCLLASIHPATSRAIQM